MFCKQCGAQIEDTATACAKCAAPVGTANAAAAVTDKVKAASKDSLQAFLKFATDPVAGLSVAYESLGTARALSVGISFGVVFALCVLVGAYRLIPQGFLPPGAGTFFKLLVCAVVPFVSLAGTSALARLVFRGKGGLSNDSFIAGASLLPLGCVLLLSTILGPGNMEVIGALAVFALCLTILMLFAGCTRITTMSERLATIAVPLMILLSAWLTKIIYAAMINPYSAQPAFPMYQ
jgi:zinc-ribbon domain